MAKSVNNNVSYLDISYFISKDLISKNNTGEIYEKIAVTADTFINCDLVTVFMLNEDTEAVSCVKFYRDGEFHDKEMTMHIGEGIIGSVAENGESLISKNLEKDLSDIYFGIESQFSGMNSILSVPIFAGSLVLGVLNVYRNEEYEFSEEEMEIAKFIALNGGIFIYSLALYENANFLYLRQKTESKKVADLLNISRLVSSNLDLTSVVDDSVHSLMEFTGTDKSLVYLKDNSMVEPCYEFFNCENKNCAIFGGVVNCYSLIDFECQFCKCRKEKKILQKCIDCPFLNNLSLKIFKSYGFSSEACEPDAVPALFRLSDCECVKSIRTGRPTINYYKDRSEKTVNGAVAESLDEFICDCLFAGVDKRTFIAVPLKTDKDFIGMLFLISGKEISYSLENMDFISDLSDIVSVAISNAMMIEFIEEEHFNTINSISEAIETRDPYTRSHGDRLIDYAIMVGRELGLGEQEIKNLRYAASLHDVGKIGIKDSILNKKGKLTEEEYAEIKKHPDIGYNMLKKINFLSQISKDVLHHQERFDGKGYPDGLKGEEIPLISRIIAVIDTFDAMTTDRPYRKALPKSVAIEELNKNSGTQFDPKVVDVFMKIFKKCLPTQDD